MDWSFTITPNLIIGFAGLVTAVGVLIGLIKSYVKQIEKWNGYDEKITNLNAKIVEKNDEVKEQVSNLKSEQYMQTKVLLAVLDGLHQLKCNGKVTEATNELTDYLNKSSHS